VPGSVALRDIGRTLKTVWERVMYQNALYTCCRTFLLSYYLSKYGGSVNVLWHS
jgi:hypothetical protein